MFDSNTSELPREYQQLANLRFSDIETAAGYPLACNTNPLNFRAVASELEPGQWHLDIPLPPVPADSLIIPSYTQLGQDNYRTQFTLLAEGQSSTLPQVPSATRVPRASTAITGSELTGVSTHIDYWLVSTQTPPLTLRLTLSGSQPNPRYLFKISIRPQQLSGALSANQYDSKQLLGVSQIQRPLSQKLGPNHIRGGICSPTATAMAMQQLSPQQQAWPTFVAACRDPATGMYGVWPLNLYQASRQGHLGAIETPTASDEVHQILAAQLPLVASIQYHKGALPSAPQPQTSGHLVLLHGILGGAALVSDPAAATTAEVKREYPLEAFLEAWLRTRGACYLLLPKA